MLSIISETSFQGLYSINLLANYFSDCKHLTRNAGTLTEMLDALVIGSFRI